MLKKMLLLSGALVVLLLSYSTAQTVTGTVYDSQSKNPLSGVKVIVKGTKSGDITKADGKYSVNVTATNQTIVFTKVGYDTKTINAQGRTIVNVYLEYGQAKVETDNELILQIVECEEEEAAVPTTRMNMSKKALMGCAPAMSYDMAFPQHNTEGYSTIHENGFKDVSKNPLSTFSVDVDAASYSNVRRFLNNGSMPPVDAVRIEEMINYFSYNYKQPTGEDPFSINTELAECPWNKENLLLHIGLQGKQIPTENLPSSNLVFLIDVSGSMSDHNKLPLLKSAFKLLTDQLRPHDKVAIVVYAGSSGLVLPSTHGSNKHDIKNALDRLNAGGSTAGGEGLILAYKVAEENFIEGGNNRIILATDGDFNVGASSNAEMERLIEKEREKGIAISVLGFGMGNYKDDKMEIIADKGNGNYSYIDNLLEAKKVLVNEFGGTLFTIAKDVKFQLEFNPANVVSYRLIGYENRLLNEEDFDDDKKDAGEIGSGHTVTALYEIVPAKNGGKNAGLKYQSTELTSEAKNSNDLITLKLRYKQPNGYNSKLLEQVVKNEPQALNTASENFMFSASVAQFGMLLRNSEFKGTANWHNTEAMAKGAKGDDENGYRSEFLQLIKQAELMSNMSEK